MKFKLGDYVFLNTNNQGTFVGKITTKKEKVRDYNVKTKSNNGNKINFGAYEHQLELATKEDYDKFKLKQSPTVNAIVSTCLISGLPDFCNNPTNWKKEERFIERQLDENGEYIVNKYYCDNYKAKVIKRGIDIIEVIIREVA